MTAIMNLVMNDDYYYSSIIVVIVVYYKQMILAVMKMWPNNIASKGSKFQETATKGRIQG